jgi:hypothetical protein
MRGTVLLLLLMLLALTLLLRATLHPLVDDKVGLHSEHLLQILLQELPALRLSGKWLLRALRCLIVIFLFEFGQQPMKIASCII